MPDFTWPYADEDLPSAETYVELDSNLETIDLSNEASTPSTSTQQLIKASTRPLIIASSSSKIYTTPTQSTTQKITTKATTQLMTSRSTTTTQATTTQPTTIQLTTTQPTTTQPTTTQPITTQPTTTKSTTTQTTTTQQSITTEDLDIEEVQKPKLNSAIYQDQYDGVTNEEVFAYDETDSFNTDSKVTFESDEGELIIEDLEEIETQNLDNKDIDSDKVDEIIKVNKNLQNQSKNRDLLDDSIPIIDFVKYTESEFMANQRRAQELLKLKLTTTACL